MNEKNSVAVQSTDRFGHSNPGEPIEKKTLKPISNCCLRLLAGSVRGLKQTVI